MSFDREKLREELIRDEGVKFEIYNDHLGYPTFGIGHLVTEADEENGQPVGTAVTEDRCWEVFDADVELFVDEVKKVYPHIETYPDTAQRVLINMCFNMGAPRLGKFQNMKKAIDELQLRVETLVGINRYQIVLKDLWSHLKAYSSRIWDLTFKFFENILYKHRKKVSKWDDSFHSDKNGKPIKVEK